MENKEIELNEPYKGYTRGVLTGNKDGLRYEIRLTSGLTIYLYEDEFTIN